MYKQIIIVRKDLEMSPGKLAAQVAHGSMAVLTSAIRNPSYTNPVTKGMVAPFGSEPQEDRTDIIGYDFEYRQTSRTEFEGEAGTWYKRINVRSWMISEHLMTM